MAEFHFYGAHDDWWLYLSRLMDVGSYHAIADLWYNEPKFLQFSVLTADIKRILVERPHVFLWSPRYSRFQPRLTSTKRPDLIDPRYCGPCLDLALPACYRQAGRWCLNFGSVSYEREYCNAETGEWYKPPPELKDDFIFVRTTLQKLMVKRYARMTQQVYEKRPEVKTLWIGPDAIRKLESGEAQIRIYTDWWKGSELGKRKG